MGESVGLSERDITRAVPAAARSKAVMRAAVLDAAFDVFLAEMHKRGLFEAFRIVFKGGTSLRKFRFGHCNRAGHNYHVTVRCPVGVGRLGSAYAAR